MSLIVDGTTGVTFNDSSLQGAAASPFGLKNRIINGDMRIDQRNAGAASTNAINGYFLDRWQVLQSTTGKIIAQQNAGSVTPPTGFTNYLGVTSQSAYTVGTSDYYMFQQCIEGFNTTDLGFGTANAKTLTLSFVVYSSLTGTFGGVIKNYASTRSYPFTYTISSANTWTTISITIAGDTSGTWAGATNSGSFIVNFGLGVGSTYSGTSGSWASANYISATGATSVVGTNGATFYITGVQLEIGSTATPFERRLYGQELINCQRYYETTAVNGAFSISETQVQIVWNAAYCTSPQFKVTKRATPTVTIYSRSGTSGQVSSTASGANVSAATASNISATGIWSINLSSGQTVYSAGMEAGFTASAEL